MQCVGERPLCAADHSLLYVESDRRRYDGTAVRRGRRVCVLAHAMTNPKVELRQAGAPKSSQRYRTSSALAESPRRYFIFEPRRRR